MRVGCPCTLGNITTGLRIHMSMMSQLVIDLLLCLRAPRVEIQHELGMNQLSWVNVCRDDVLWEQSSAMNAVRALSACSGESKISGRAEEERRDWESWQASKLSPGLVETGELGVVGMVRRGRVGK